MFQNKKLKRNATYANAEVAEVALCASNCALPTSDAYLLGHFCRLYLIVLLHDGVYCAITVHYHHPTDFRGFNLFCLVYFLANDKTIIYIHLFGGPQKFTPTFTTLPPLVVISKKGFQYVDQKIFRVLDCSPTIQKDKRMRVWGIARLKIEICFSLQVSKFTPWVGQIYPRLRTPAIFGQHYEIQALISEFEVTPAVWNVLTPEYRHRVRKSTAYSKNVSVVIHCLCR